MKKIFLILTVILTLSAAVAQTVKIPASAMRNSGKSVFQFSTETHFSDPKGKEYRAVTYLWVPENCREVKAVIVSNQNVLEQWIVEDERVREVCEKNSVAIIWSCPGFFTGNDFGELNVSVCEKILDDFSKLSGYDELSNVPWIALGHSGTNNLVRQIMELRPEKVLAAMTMKGGPGFGQNRTIPVLCTGGEFFEWGQQKNELVEPIKFAKNFRDVQRERAERDLVPISYIIDPGTGHFESGEKLTGLIAEYIDDIIALRLNSDGSLKKIDIDRGWVVGYDVPGEEKHFAPVRQDKTESTNPWFPSKRLAQKATVMANVDWNRKAQITAFANEDGSMCEFDKSGIVWPLPYRTQSDGVTFTVNTIDLNQIPSGFLNEGIKLGANANKPYIEILCGIIEHVEEARYRIALNRSYKGSAIYLSVRKEGDAAYRTSVQPAQFVLKQNNEGVAQNITFDKIADQKTNVKSIELNAVSDSGMPVKFFVRSGPVTIEGNKLIFTKTPPKTKFPVAVTVVAWQLGRDTHPKIQAAKLIEQTFYIVE